MRFSLAGVTHDFVCEAGCPFPVNGPQKGVRPGWVGGTTFAQCRFALPFSVETGREYARCTNAVKRDRIAVIGGKSGRATQFTPPSMAKTEAG